MSVEVGIPSGAVKFGKLYKTIKPENILRYPEKSFTFDKQIYDNYRAMITHIVVICGKKTYKLCREDFEDNKTEYNYGNGMGYRIPVRLWEVTSEQLGFEIDG
jgi:hypothetical protein